jgi:outer membrane protein OmpA-like peptidoglycan-associated protein
MSASVSRALGVAALLLAAMLAASSTWGAQVRVFEPSDAIDAREITRIFSIAPTPGAEPSDVPLPRTRGIRKVADRSGAVPPAIALKFHFAIDSTSIPPAARKQLDAVAQGLKALGGQPHIIVEGHTDASGSDEHNDALSLGRARAVRDYLITRGVSASWLEPRGLGRSALLDTTIPMAPENRRVELRRIS